MEIRGACHCGNIVFTLAWPDAMPTIPARACACTFCRKHGASWTSHPDGRLRVTMRNPDEVARYEFGTRTAHFLVCRACGVVPVAISRIDGQDYAVVNVDTFEGIDPLRLDRSHSDFDGEATEDRLARRKARWIAEVRLDVSG